MIRLLYLDNSDHASCDVASSDAASHIIVTELITKMWQHMSDRPDSYYEIVDTSTGMTIVVELFSENGQYVAEAYRKHDKLNSAVAITRRLAIRDLITKIFKVA